VTREEILGKIRELQRLASSTSLLAREARIDLRYWQRRLDEVNEKEQMDA
jgi:hypothetical protein